jgi:apolipoprotein N-acyltransferase
MVCCEFVVPVLFPFGLWITQAWHPLVIQIAELTGPRGVTALLLLVNGALFDQLATGRDGADADPTLRPRRTLAAPRAALATAAIIAAALLLGALRMRQIDALAAMAPQLKVGLVQPNFAYPIDGHLTPGEARAQLSALQSESAALEREGADIVVWSESSYPGALPRALTHDLAPGASGMIRRGLHLPLIAGALTRDADNGELYNSAILIDREGWFVGRYDKVRLLAFGEYVPAIDAFPWLRNVTPEGVGRFTAGPGPGVMPLRMPDGRQWNIGPVICYEDILPSYLRRVGALHPDLLVNLTSDSWFGARAEPWQHLALAVFASVELRLATVRAVDTGVSTMIDPDGRVLRRTYAVDPFRDPHPPDRLLVTVPVISGGRTLFAVAGDWFAALCVGATVLVTALSRRRRTQTLGRATAQRSRTPLRSSSSGR